MLYKASPMGYFGRVTQISHGPWFNQTQADDDNLEIYFRVLDTNGTHYLLSNNMSYEDREDFVRLYRASNRADWMAFAAGLGISMELTLKHPYFRKMAAGWRIVSMLGMATVLNGGFN